MAVNSNSGTPKPSRIEEIKRNSNQLRGTIAEELAEPTPKFVEENVQLLKFHGVYQQEDRDVRAKARKKGGERKHMMMMRTRVPGGFMTADAYLGMDAIAQKYGNRTLRITTRQTFQFHGVLKGNLKAAIADVNKTMLTTLGGCGDQMRNITACPAPFADGVHQQAHQYVNGIVALLGAKTNAYFELFLDGEKVAASPEEEPVYGAVYMPRKFKFGIAIEGDNCIDVYTNDVGLVAHVSGRSITGFTILSGGSMGATHNKPDTYPKMGIPIGWVPPEKVLIAAKAILEVQRDNGDRSDRRHARLKYTMERMGLQNFISEVERYMGEKLEPPKPLTWNPPDDHFGWQEQGDGRWFYGVWVQNGRVVDGRERKLRTAIRKIVRKYRCDVRLTAQQNLFICNIPTEEKAVVDEILASHGVPRPDELSRPFRQAMACPATPTCGLAVAEAERGLPELLRHLDADLHELGLDDAPISIRMTGCPNGCARAYVGDIGFVGRTVGKYNVHIGGDFAGTRLNTLWKETVDINEIPALLRPLFEDYAQNRSSAEESFGDFCVRTGIVASAATASVAAG